MSEDNNTNNTPIGALSGQVRWFNNTRGYGFITIHGEQSQDVFVHQTNIHPAVSTYRSLVEGEYVSLDISQDDKKQAINVRGINGGSLRCDAIQQRKDYNRSNRTSNTNETNDDSRSERGGRSGRGGRGRTGRGRNNRRRNDQPRPRGTNLSEYIPADAVAAVSHEPSEGDSNNDEFTQA
tara:strand:+ start:66 stop:605 length:540 start_codon:yes stop_codon:yes gene_type:complete